MNIRERDMFDALTRIRDKADHAKDNPRIQTDKLFDIIELCDEVLNVVEDETEDGE